MVKKTIKAQWVGEFGHELFCFQGSLRQLSKTNNVEITCFKGNDFLYKDFATKITTIDKPINYEPDCANENSGYNYGNNDYDIPPKREVINMNDPNLLTKQSWVKFGELNNNNNNYDIILHCRNTNKNGNNDWNWGKDNWDNLYNKLISKGYNVACIGTTKMSYKPINCNSYDDYRDKPTNITVNLLRNAKVIMGESSGPMHLATLCGLPQIIWSKLIRSKSRYEKLWNPFNVKVKHILDNNPTPDSLIKVLDNFNKNTVLSVGVFTPNSTNISQLRGFAENNYDVYKYDYRNRVAALHNIKSRDDELINLIKQLKPNIILFNKCNQMHYRVVDVANEVSTTILLYPDAFHNYDNELKEKIKRCNYFITGTEGVSKGGFLLNKNTQFINQCPDDKMNFKINNLDLINDIVFIGSNSSSEHSERKDFINTLNTNFKSFKHYNNVYGLVHNKIINQTKININFSPTDRSGTSVRVYKILASGGFLLTTPWLNIDKTFIDGEHLVLFNNKEELVEKINYYLKYNDERERIRLNGYKKSQEFTPKNWAKKIVQFVSEHKETSNVLGN